MKINNQIQLEIEKEHLNAFLACLGIGTLQAIQKGTISPDIGILSLGNPKTLEYLSNNPGVSHEIISVFQTFDELSAIQKLIPDKFDEILSELDAQLHTALRALEKREWYFNWADELE